MKKTRLLMLAVVLLLSLSLVGMALAGDNVLQEVNNQPDGPNGIRGGTPDKIPPVVTFSPADFGEGFDDITNLPDWYMQNNSDPIGVLGWFQGNDSVFPAHSGDPTAYIAGNYNSASEVGTISNWLLTPEQPLSDGSTFSFWTRTGTSSPYPDRLQVRLSMEGSSTDVGTGAEDVGDFITLLLDINPDLQVGGYPEVWTQYTITLSGIPGGTTGRLAFRYYVTGGGPYGNNSNYIGIDTVTYESIPDQVEQRLYLTSLDIGDATFAAYDPATDSWTGLNDYETGCQMAVSSTGQLYAYGYNTSTIDIYDPATDTWSPVMAAPPGSTGSYCNLEITNAGELLYTEAYNSMLWYTSGGVWNTLDLPFETDAMGDYDPTTDQFVIGEYAYANAHMINVHDWSITDYYSQVPAGEYARFGVVMDNKYFFEIANSNLYDFELDFPGNPPIDHGFSPGWFTSAAGDRANGKIYSASIDGLELNLIDPVANTMTPLTGYTVSIWHSSVALVSSGLAEGPEINITPPALFASQGPDEVTQQVLNVGNIGNQDLNWELSEGLGMVGWEDNFDGYPTGVSLHGLGGWKGWGNNPAATAYTSDTFAFSPPNSVDINGDSDLVHEYSGYTSGVWTYSAMQYIPSGMVGQSYFILLNQYDDAGVNNNWSTQVYFDYAAGLVVNTGLGAETLPIITDQWVSIQVVIDLDNDVQTFYYGGDMLYTGSWKDGISGGGIANIAAVDLFANLATSVYYDDISLASPAVDIPWLSEAPTSGTTPPGGSVPVDVTFDSTGLMPGTYMGSLFATSNDVDEPVVEVPVTLEVVGQLPDIDVTPTELSSSQAPDQQMVETLNIANVGGDFLDWNIYEDNAAGLSKIVPSTPAPASAPAVSNSLSQNTSFAPATPGQVMKSVDSNLLALINDGSFENGPPPGSAWTEVSDQPCEWIGDWSSVWGVAAFDGIYDYWAGGYCGGIPTTSHVSQAISVPAGNPTLSFWYLAYRPDPDDANPDYAYISVDGTNVWTLDLIQANNSYPNWVNVTLDLSAYAGQDVTLAFGAVSAGSNTGNIRFDYIEWLVSAVCESPTDIPWLSESPTEGSTPGGESTPVDVTFDSTGLQPDIYTAVLCVASNDVDEPLVIVPVTLEVLPPDIFVTAPPLEMTLYPGQDGILNFTIENVGVADLIWSVTDGADWLYEFPEEGLIPPEGAPQVVDVHFDATLLIPGTYTTDVVISSNDPDTPEIVLPATLTIIPYISDLSLVKTANADAVRVGDMITYTLVVSNAGPDAAMGVTVVDTLPIQVTFVSASAGCTEASGVVTCAVGDLGVHEGTTLTIVVTASTEGIAGNVAVVGSDSDDPNPADNESAADVLINPEMFYFYLPIVQKH